MNPRDLNQAGHQLMAWSCRHWPDPVDLLGVLTTSVALLIARNPDAADRADVAAAVIEALQRMFRKQHATRH